MLVKSGKASVHQLRKIRDTLSLLLTILAQIPTGTLSHRIDLGSENPSEDSASPLARALRHYATNIEDSVLASVSKGDIPLMTSLEDIFAISALFAGLARENTEIAEDGLLQALSLLGALVSRVEDRFKSPLQIDWAPAQWLAAIISVVPHVGRLTLAHSRKSTSSFQASFELLDGCVAALTSVARAKYIVPSLHFDQRPVISELINSVSA